MTVMHSQDQIPFHIFTAQQCPDLIKTLDEPDHPLNLLWPDFLDEDLIFKEFVPKLAEVDSLKRFQFLAVEQDSTTGENQVIGLARSIPFYWKQLSSLGPGELLCDRPKILETLPDGGYDTILALGVQQALARQASVDPTGLQLEPSKYTADAVSNMPPNTLSALSISVRKDRRKTGLAEIFIRKMKQTAIDERLQALVVPLRPTQKPSHPLIEMAEYVKWTNNMPGSFGHLSSTLSPLDSAQDPERQQILHFDPWLRKHLRLGGRIVKVAHNSMVVRGTAEQWRAWTGADFDRGNLEHDTACLHPEDVNVVIPGGLVPVRYNKKEKIGVYVEPNVWVFHELRG